MVSGADRSEPSLGFSFEGRHWAKGCLWLGSRLGPAGLGEVFKFGALLRCWSTSAPLALAPLAAFKAILGHYKEKKKELIAVGLPRVRQGEGDVSFLELAGQSFVCCVGRAPRIEGNSVVPELGSFFSFMPSPAPLSACNLFGLKISFPNSLRAVLLF